MRILLGITGASGAIYARRLIGHLGEIGVETHCSISEAARQTWRWELEEEFDEAAGRWPHLRLYGERDWMSPMASGSFRHDGMAVMPCSMKTLGSVANGIADSLVPRAAEVCLKERRKLVLVVRETPYALPHLDNMRQLTLAGATILPASPGFYHRPRSIDELVDFVVARTLDHLGIENDLIQRWGPARPTGD